jgi:predicted regulator of Ras-like GTPase activity (Roadblock/LC7/MglB family)
MCCRLPAGVSPSLQQLLARALIKIGDVFPGTDMMLVLRQDGSAVYYQQFAPDADQAEVTAVVSSLKRAALQLADTLGQTQCPALHVKGGKNIFSCYDAGTEFTLAFFTPMSESELELFDTSQADSLMVPILEELKILLQGSV